MTLPVADMGRPGGGGIGRPPVVVGRGGAAGRGVDGGVEGAVGPPTRASAGRGAGSGRPLEMIGPELEIVRSLEIVAAGGASATGAGRATGAASACVGAGDAATAGSATGAAGSAAGGASATTGSGSATTSAGASATDAVSTETASTGAASTGAVVTVSASTGVCAAGCAATSGSTTGVTAGVSAGASAGAGAAASAGAGSAEATVSVLAAAFLAGLPAFSGSGGCSSRVRPSRTARRRTMSAYASANEEEWLLTGTPSALARSTVSALVMPSSCASSCTRMFFATLRFNLSLCAVSQGRRRSPPAQFVNSCRS